MRELGIDLLFSSIPADAVPSVYGSRLPGCRRPSDAYRLRAGKPRGDARGRVAQNTPPRRGLPGWARCSSLAGDSARTRSSELGARVPGPRGWRTDLRCDISWTRAGAGFYGGAWYRVPPLLTHHARHRERRLDRRLRRLAAGKRTDSHLRAHPAATFDDVEREHPRAVRGQWRSSRPVSPRVFEAAALGTAMVNFPGSYSNVVGTGVHYVPLEKDFSNFDEVVQAGIGDGAVLERHGVARASRILSSRAATPSGDLRAGVRPRGRGAGGAARPAPGTAFAGRRGAEPEATGGRAPPVAEPARRGAFRRRTANARGRAGRGRRLIRRFPEIDALAQSQPATREAAARSRPPRDGDGSAPTRVALSRAPVRRAARAR